MKRMLIDAAHPEETRVAVLDGNQLEEFDVESASRKQLKGNIYLAKVTRVEPSLQAAFVDYGGNRHGFLAFNEIHPDYYQIPVADRERLLAEQAEEDEAEEAAERAREAREDAREAARAQRQAENGGAQPADGHDDAHDDEHDEDDEHHEAHADQHRDHDNQPDASASDDGESHHETDAATDDEPSNNADREPRNTTMAEAMPEPESVQGPIVEQHDVEPSAVGEQTDAPVATEQASDSEPADHAEHAERTDNAETAEDGEGAEPEHSAIIEQVVHAGPAKPLETVGGDDVDEAVERRRPPQRAMRRYKIQEVIKRRQILLVQVVKEERGNKGAALTTYLSLAGRYCVLMPNTGKGGGISRKIGGGQDRKRLKSIISDLEVPRGMALIVRTAGADRNKAEIKRDYDYLLRLWNDIRTLTLASSAPALIHGEASIINRAIRDLYTRDIEEVVVEGDDAYRVSKDLMKMLIPSHTKKVQQYKDESVPLFARYGIENQLEGMNSPTVQLKSGGYIVMNATEALVAIDVNSGRATRGRNIEETALRTNTEAATEIARQLRLRDLAGLVVIDFIDMDHSRNQTAVERRLKEAMRRDRARIQIGRISPFGLLELSRQRLRPSLAETVTDMCPHCAGTGILRSTESTALHVLRGIEEEAMKRRATALTVAMSSSVALYLLNHKRAHLLELETKFQTHIIIASDDALIPPKYTIERSSPLHHDGDEGEERSERPARPERNDRNDRNERHERSERPERSERQERSERPERQERSEQQADGEQRREQRDGEGGSEDGGRRRRRRRGRRRGGEDRPEGNRDNQQAQPQGSRPADDDEDDFDETNEAGVESNDGDTRNADATGGENTQPNDERSAEGRRRRGRRGGRGRNRGRREDGTPRPDQAAQANGQPAGDALDGFETDADGEESDQDAPFDAAQPGTPGEGGRRRRRVRRRRGPRTDGDTANADTSESTSPAAAEPTLWAASDRDEPQPTASMPEPTLIETSPTPAPAPIYVEPAPAPTPPPPTPKVEEEAPAGPPRRGWWQRLTE